MAAERLPLKQTQLSNHTNLHDIITDIMQRLDKLFNDFWERLQSRKQTAQIKHQDLLEVGKKGRGQRGARKSPSGKVPVHQPILTRPSPPELKAKRVLTVIREGNSCSGSR
ncbi:Hypothetical predicted protein [Pelobates cultripes]|uniref:Uncharacterized protein n=1 Tax=Pelobates cultripes TaxID=61616 RepID=A0AAD1WHW5_PELCU|nr:Hypothetical predicted protein [Pelobates cultripes]